MLNINKLKRLHTFITISCLPMGSKMTNAYNMYVFNVPHEQLLSQSLGVAQHNSFRNYSGIEKTQHNNRSQKKKQGRTNAIGPPALSLIQRIAQCSERIRKLRPNLYLVSKKQSRLSRKRSIVFLTTTSKNNSTMKPRTPSNVVQKSLFPLTPIRCHVAK